MDKELLKGIADNPSLLAALRKLLEDKFSTDSLTADQTDVVLGQMVRARLVGLKAVDEAFQEIAKYKTQPPTPDRWNPSK